MRLFSGFVLVVLLATGRCFSSDTKIFVSPKGNDQAGGEEPGKAVASVERALEIGRAERQKTPDAKISIVLQNGRFELKKPVTIGAADSGASAQNPLVIMAGEGAKPVISGGRQITGWKKSTEKPNLWTVEIPEAREGKWIFRQLIVNGKRAQRARTPNEGFYRINGPSPQDKPVKIRFKEQQIKKEWADLGDVEVIALLAWADIRMPIRSVDETNHVATLAGNPRPSNQEANAQFYIENAPDALDAPGEFYLDRKTGTLSYIARQGEDLSSAEVIAPVLDDLVFVTGDAKSLARHIIFRGITFSDTNWELGENGYADTQAAVAVRGDLLAEHAVDLRIEDCTFTHLAGYAIELGQGAQQCRIIGNEMTDLGAGGIRIGETAKRTELPEQNFGHVVTDNHIHNCGIVYPPAVGVFIMQSGTNRIAHNHIHHLYYTAVSVGWNWGYQETPCRENIIEFNHLHDIGQGVLSDMGAVYTLGIQKGSVVRNNLIHDVNAFTYGGWGLYPDEGSTDIIWENNVVYRCKNAGFHQHYGRENIVRNNIFAMNLENQLMRTRDEEHISFFLTNNIVYWKTGKLLGSSWKNDKYVIDSNVYFNPNETEETIKFAGATLSQWRARGHDQKSIIADPLFVAPESFDFRLTEKSPALALGFKPIDLSKVGIRAKADRKY